MTTYVVARRRIGAGLLALTTATAGFFMFGSTTADAAIVPTIELGTAANYSVLAGSTVTNTGPSVLNKGLGLHPGTSVTGFPPGIVQGTYNVTDAAALAAKNALTAAYVDAAGRPVNETTVADLTGLTLVGGVFGTTANGALGLTGTLTLDGDGNPNSVFIFQTASTLTIGSSGVVNLIGGASACNVFWQVGSSATLNSGASFVGNIMAQASVTVNAGATIQGRALAQTGAVTLINDTFNTPTCAGETPDTATPTTTTTPGGGPTTGTTPGGGSTTGTTPGGGTGTGTDTGIDLTGEGPGVPGVSGPPRTGGAPLMDGSSPWLAVLFTTLIGAGTAGAYLRRRATASADALVEH